MKRLLATILTLSLCFSCFLLAFDEVNVEAAISLQKNNKAASLLNSLGILLGDEQGNLMLDKKVTRAQFTAIIIRTLGLEEMAQGMMGEKQSFSDVGQQHWAFGYVNLSKQMGLVDGIRADYFGADKVVSFSEAVKITVTALGYREVAESRGGYPKGYEQIARSIGLLRDVPVLDEMSRQASCNLIYNALTARLHGDAYEETGNILSNYLNFTVIEGVITATYGYQKNIQLKKDEIELDGTAYKCKVSDADEYIGMRAECYVRDDADTRETIYYIHAKGNYEDSIVFAEDISPETTLREFFYYDESDRQKSLKIEDGFTAFYNGKLLPANEIVADDLKIASGMVVLRDANGNGKVETILIDAYKDYVVNYVTDDKIYAKFGGNIDLEETKEEDLTIENNGVKITLADIKNGDILSILQSRDGEKTKILVSTESRTGYITEIENKSSYQDIYTLSESDGTKTTFQLAQNYRQALAVNHIDTVKLTLSNNRLIRIYYNSFGLVSDIAVLADEGGFNYGFLNAVQLDKGIRSDAQFEILTTANRFEVFKTKNGEKLKFGRRVGSEYKISNEDAETVVRTLSTKQLVKYKTDKDGYLQEIYKADAVTSNDHFSIGPEAEGTQMDYRDNVFGMKYYVDQNTAVFSVHKGGEYKEIMSAGKYTTYLNNGAAKYCTFYDVEGSYVNALLMNAPVATLYKTDADGYEIILDYVNSSLLYIDDIIYKTAENGETYMCLKGYQDGEPYSIYVADSLMVNSEARENLKKGIVIQYEDNDIYSERAQSSDLPKQVVLFKTVYDFTSPREADILWDYKDLKSSRPQICTLWGNVESATQNSCTLSIEGESYTASIHENTMILRYDKETKRFIKEKLGAVNEGQRVFIRQRYLNTREVVIY